MKKLEEYENLINAMSALFYVSRQMSNQIPCVLHAWREYTLERRARKIQDILSSAKASNTVMSEPVALSQIMG